MTALRSSRAGWIAGVVVLSTVAVFALTRREAPPPATPPAAPSTPPSASVSPTPQPRPSTQAFALTDGEIARLTKQADSGSGAAAYRLALYYETVLRDYAQAKRWMKTAAENGDIGGMYGYAGYLKGSSDAGDRATARAWLEKVAAKGDDVSKLAARRDLRQLESQSEAER